MGCDFWWGDPLDYMTRSFTGYVTLFIESFDYYAGMQYLRTTRVTSFNKENDPMTTVFQALGYAYGSLPQPQAYALVCSLLQYSQLDHRIQNRDRLAPFTQRLEMPSHLSDPMSEATPQSDAYNEEALPKYTSALFERGQEDGKKLERTVSTLSLDPPQFRVIIRFGALHGSGIGRSKKIARHLAAKALCHRLRITI